MPELPEVETVVRDLRPLLIGQRLHALTVGRKALRRPWVTAWTKQVVGRTVAGIERRGKWILVDLGEPWLLVHLGMTGQFTVAGPEIPRQDHTHLVFQLDAGELRFRDIRRFGSVSFYSTRADLDAHFETMQLGPEPFDVLPEYWHAALAKTNRNLKAILLDQTILAGVGNIYADEALFTARLHPSRLGSSLTKTERENLRLAIATVLGKAINLRGSSIRNYVGGSGLMGKMQAEFSAYGRTGEECVRCATAIERIVLAGRSTHFCPKCQKVPRRRK